MLAPCLSWTGLAIIRCVGFGFMLAYFWWFAVPCINIVGGTLSELNIQSASNLMEFQNMLPCFSAIVEQQLFWMPHMDCVGLFHSGHDLPSFAQAVFKHLQWILCTIFPCHCEKEFNKSCRRCNRLFATVLALWSVRGLNPQVGFWWRLLGTHSVWWARTGMEVSF